MNFYEGKLEIYEKTNDRHGNFVGGNAIVQRM